MGGQEHFYLETHCALVVPKEDEIEIYCSSQNAAEIQVLFSLLQGKLLQLNFANMNNV